MAKRTAHIHFIAANLALALVLIGAIGCTTSTVDHRVREVRFAESKTEIVAYYKVYRDGKQVGSLERHRLVDGDNLDANDRYHTVVFDHQKQRVGFVTDDARAYRFTAHGPNELVSNDSKLENAVRTLLGWESGAVSIDKERLAD